jgi:hypothetical protein
MKKKPVREVIKTLEDLRKSADMRSRNIIVDGREVSDQERAVSAAYADAYSFCILKLREIVE